MKYKGIIYIILLFALLLAIKLTCSHVIYLSWWWTLFPLAILITAVVFVLFLILELLAQQKRKSKYRSE